MTSSVCSADGDKPSLLDEGAAAPRNRDDPV